MIVDEPTFEQIVNTHYQPLYRFAFSLARGEAQAWDLTQETFRKFAVKGHQLAARSKVKTWLFTTLYREFIDGQRRDSRVEPMADGEHELDPVALPDQEEKFDGALAREALLQIDPVFRAPLVLFYLQDHSYREIADILKVPLGTVMSRISRGRGMLREALRDRGRSGAAAPVGTVSDVR
jgi:RNA polymerase sigma-70 factor (ECF subfamily)